MSDKMREFVDEVKQLCKDFSDQRDRPYMGDVHAALDGLYEQWQAAQAEQSVPVVGEVVGYLAGGTLMRRKIHGYDCKPLIIRPKNSITTAELERMRKCADALKQMLWIVHDSSGVAGYHLNGDIAEWESFPEYHAALAAIAAEG